MANSKKAAAKPAAKKTPAKKAVAKKAPTPRKPKPGPRCIRNVLGVQQNLRLQGDRDKPYAITLRPRGQRGDAAWVPLQCQEDPAFLHGLDLQFEIITDAEYKDLQASYPPVGYTGRSPLLPSPVTGNLQETTVKVTRSVDQVISTSTDPHAQAAAIEGSSPTDVSNASLSVGPRVAAPVGSAPAYGNEAGEGSSLTDAEIKAQIDAQSEGRKPLGH